MKGPKKLKFQYVRKILNFINKEKIVFHECKGTIKQVFGQYLIEIKEKINF